MDDTHEFSRRRLLETSLAAGVLAGLAGCSGTDDGPSAPGTDATATGTDATEATSRGTEETEASEEGGDDEPDPPPEAVADGFDLEAARDATREAIRGVPFEVAGFRSQFEEGDADATRRSRMKAGRGDAADTARHVDGRGAEFTLADRPSDADSFLDRYFADGTLVRRSVRDGDADYDSDEATYEEFARLVERDLRSYYEVGTNFEFGEPAWNPDEGVYEVRGTGIADDSEVDEDVEIRECVVTVDADGVVVSISAELFLEGTVVRTAVDGTPGIDVSIEEPGWVSEAEEALPVWTYRTGDRPTTTVVGDAAYVSSSDGVVALDRLDGSTVWEFSVESGSPVHAVSGDAVFVGASGGEAYALSREDGTEQWSASVGDDSGTPHPVEERVLFVGRTGATALATDDGTEAWSLSTDTDRRLSGRVIAEDVLYVSDLRGRVDAVDVETGDRRWQFDAPTQNWLSPSAVVDGRLYAGSFDGAVYAIDVDDGTPEWTVPTADMVTSVSLDGDAVYVGNRAGEVYALDADDGSTTWTAATADTTRVHPHPEADAVLVASHDGSLSRLSAGDGTEQWTFEADGWVESPTVAGEAVYVGSRDSNLYGLDPDDGSVRWRRETDAFVRHAPAVAGDLLYATGLGSGGGIVYAFERAADT
ncbi:MAG: PQQ-binding-like beta-propeller repeat protein [Haloferacaceae archaeon]